MNQLVLTTAESFALSDGCDPDFQVVCTQQHIESCDQCQTLKAVLDEVEAEIRGSSWNPYNEEHREDLLYDFEGHDPIYNSVNHIDFARSTGAKPNKTS